MIYASICDGIGAAHAAWQPLGWRCAWTSEIEPFPIAVVEHHWHLPNLGDMTRITETQLEQHGRIDLLVGGTPCQSFSVAGLRGGLDDARGNLALRFFQLAHATRARWLVWENVPGVLSSNGGRDFGAILGAMVGLGYGFAYRVLDAQYFGLAQRRKRVFVVGHLGDWRRAAAVLFERESLSGNPPPSREAGKGTAVSVIKGAAIGREPKNGPQFGDSISDGTCYTLNCTEVHAVATHCPAVSPALKSRDYKGPSSDGDGDGDGAPLIAHAIPFDTTQITSKANRSSPKPGDPCHPLAAGAHAPAIALAHQQGGSHDLHTARDVALTVQRHHGQAVASARFGVRRITPLEAERLQGFPDYYTAIQYRGKPAADGPRYKALGNSMARPVMEWIGRRIQIVDQLTEPPCTSTN